MRIRKETSEKLMFSRIPSKADLLVGFFVGGLVVFLVYFHFGSLGFFQVRCWKKTTGATCSTQVLGAFGFLAHKTNTITEIQSLYYHRKAFPGGDGCREDTHHEVLAKRKGSEKKLLFWKYFSNINCVWGDFEIMNGLVQDFQKFQKSTTKTFQFRSRNWTWGGLGAYFYATIFLFWVFVVCFWRGLVWEVLIVDKVAGLLTMEKWTRFKREKRESFSIEEAWSFQVEKAECSGDDNVWEQPSSSHEGLSEQSNFQVESEEEEISMYALSVKFSKGTIELVRSNKKNELIELRKTIDDFLRKDSQRKA